MAAMRAHSRNGLIWTYMDLEKAGPAVFGRPDHFPDQATSKVCSGRRWPHPWIVEVVDLFSGVSFRVALRMSRLDTSTTLYRSSEGTVAAP